MKVYQAINAVQAALSKDGITKDRRNQQQGYNFRGIDDVYNALSPLLAKNGLCILPRCLSRSCEERQTAKGGTLFYVTVEAEFDFVSAEDGSKHTVKTFGEAMDSGDKATNKAMSAAYKYAAFQAFAIPTEGDNDADAVTHIVQANVKPTAGAVEQLSPQDRATVSNAHAEIAALLANGDPHAAYGVYVDVTDADQKAALWSLMSREQRSEIKATGEALNIKKAE